MITILENSLTDNDIKKLFSLWFENQKSIIEYNKKIAQLDILVLKPFLDILNLNFMYPLKEYSQIQMQCQNESWGSNDYENSFHTHHEYANLVYVQYLNDNFDGGKLIFETGEEYKPKKGDTVIFPSTLGHYVETPRNFKEIYFNYSDNDSVLLNKRWVVAGFVNSKNSLEKIL